LLEAKWHGSPISASELYAFKGKVDGKLTGTRGVFISMSGYAEDAVGAFEKGKILNIVCFDSSDIQAVVLEGRTFAEILKWKIRKASETGSVYVPYEMEAQVAKATRQGVREIARRSIPESVVDLRPTLLILCEGEADAEVLEHIIQTRYAQDMGPENIKLQIIAADGLHSLERRLPEFINIADSQYSDRLAGIVLFLDNDAKSKQTSIERRLQSMAMKVPVYFAFYSWELAELLTQHRQHHDLDYSAQIGKFIADSSLAGIFGFIEQIDTEFEPLPLWEEEAYFAVEKALSTAKWNPTTGTVEIYEEDEPGRECHSFDELMTVLIETAAKAADSYMPYEGGEPVFSYDEYSTIEPILEDYRSKMEELGWKL
jgi:hypothetical protein